MFWALLTTNVVRIELTMSGAHGTHFPNQISTNVTQKILTMRLDQLISMLGKKCFSSCP